MLIIDPSVLFNKPTDTQLNQKINLFSYHPNECIMAPCNITIIQKMNEKNQIDYCMEEIVSKPYANREVIKHMGKLYRYGV